MDAEELRHFVRGIVRDAKNLKDKHTAEEDALVNYACIFCQSDNQYNTLVETAQELGDVVKETSTGPLFHIQPLDTVAGKLRLLKVRQPDETRPERGDADFTVSDYPAFKEEYLPRDAFSLMVRENMEMMELVDPEFDVRAYFSHPTLEEQIELDAPPP